MIHSVFTVDDVIVKGDSLRSSVVVHRPITSFHRKGVRFDTVIIPSKDLLVHTHTHVIPH